MADIIKDYEAVLDYLIDWLIDDEVSAELSK